MASGTSLALPRPTPTWPWPSPTTTSAAKPKRRPPFTTLATRLMLTSFSTNSLSSRSRPCRSPPSRPPRPPRSPCARAIEFFLEVEAALAGGVGQGLDPAVIDVAAAVEHDRLDPGRLGALGEQLAHRNGSLDRRTGLELAAQL